MVSAMVSAMAYAGSQDMLRRVLIADDERDIRQLLRMALEWEGYEVVTRANGKEAVDFLAGVAEPWIVLLDVMMPGLTGLEVCDRLDQVGAGGRQHRVVLMTASGLQAHECPPAVRGLVRKPFDLDAMLDLVAALADE